MAKVAKIKLNRAGVRRLLKSKEMQAICTEHAEEIAARCGGGGTLWTAYRWRPAPLPPFIPRLLRPVATTTETTPLRRHWDD